MNVRTILVLIVALPLLGSCGRDTETIGPKTSQFPEPTTVWTTPTINKDRTYFHTLDVESEEQWLDDAEALVRTLFDADLPMETAWFSLSPSVCSGHREQGLIIVDLTRPSQDILRYGFQPQSPFSCVAGQSAQYEFADPVRFDVPDPETIDGGDLPSSGVLHYLGFSLLYMTPEELLDMAERILSDLAESGVEPVHAWMPQDTGCDCGGQSFSALVVDAAAESQFLLSNYFWTDDRPGANDGVRGFWAYRYEE